MGMSMIAYIIDWINQNPLPSILGIQAASLVYGMIKLAVEFRTNRHDRHSFYISECKFSGERDKYVSNGSNRQRDRD